MVAKTEAGDRPIRLNEAVDLAFLFGQSLELMLLAEQEPALVAEINRLQELLMNIDDHIVELAEQRDRVAADLDHTKQQAQVTVLLRTGQSPAAPQTMAKGGEPA